MTHSILDTIGHTPLVEIKNLNPNPKVNILAKLEYFNPGGSIKDRAALFMIETAEKSGKLTPDKTVIEATSGNTGIGLALVCSVKGYRLLLAMSEAASVERQKILKARGAEILLTPGHLGTDGAIEEVNTRERLIAARAAGALSEAGAGDLIDAYDLISRIRLEHQARRLHLRGQVRGQARPHALGHHQDVVDCISGDGCCPAGCTLLGDGDANCPYYRTESIDGVNGFVTGDEDLASDAQAILDGLERSGGKIYGPGGAAELLHDRRGRQRH